MAVRPERLVSLSPKLMAVMEAAVGVRSAVTPTIWTETLRVPPPGFTAESGKT